MQLYEALHVGEHQLKKERHLLSRLEDLQSQLLPLERVSCRLQVARCTRRFTGDIRGPFDVARPATTLHDAAEHVPLGIVECARPLVWAKRSKRERSKREGKHMSAFICQLLGGSLSADTISDCDILKRGKSSGSK